ncbi:MAG: amidohydrolase family protein [Clostridiales bacterium]|nr:amidohydrolase family protein [Clostridiales bacterium]
MLSECHGHIMMDGISYQASVSRHGGGVCEAAIRENFDALRSRGITYFRDGGDALGVSERAAAIAPEYGITYSTPVFAIHRKGHYGSIVGRSYDSAAQYRELLKEAASRGACFVKLMLSGLIDFTNFGRVTGEPLGAEEIRTLVHIAHEEGFRVMAHVNGADPVRDALEAGVDSIEHGCYIDREGLDILKEKRAVWVPTIAAIAAFTARGDFPGGVTRQILSTQLQAVCEAFSKGVLVASGSDSGAVGVKHGRGLENELALLRAAGGSRAAVIIGRANAALRRRFRGRQPRRPGACS